MMVYDPISGTWINDATGATEAQMAGFTDPGANGNEPTPTYTGGSDSALGALGGSLGDIFGGSSSSTTTKTSTPKAASSKSSGGSTKAASTGTWTIHTAPDGSLFEVNSLTGETQAITGAGSGTKPAAGHYSVIKNPDGSTSLLNTDTGAISFLAPPDASGKSGGHNIRYVQGIGTIDDHGDGTYTVLAPPADSAKSANPGGYYVTTGGSGSGNTFNITGLPAAIADASGGSRGSGSGGNTLSEQAAMMNAQTNAARLAMDQANTADTNRINAAKTLADVISSTDPAALPAFLAAGGGNIFNAAHNGATALDNTALAPAAALLAQYGFTPGELTAAGIPVPTTATGGAPASTTSNTPSSTPVATGNTTTAGTGNSTTGETVPLTPTGDGLGNLLGTIFGHDHNPGGPMLTGNGTGTQGGTPAPAHLVGHPMNGPAIDMAVYNAQNPYGSELDRMLGGKLGKEAVDYNHYNPAAFDPTLAAGAVIAANNYHRLTGLAPQNIEANGSLNPFVNPDGSANYAAFAGGNPYTGEYQAYNPHAGMSLQALQSLPASMLSDADKVVLANAAAGVPTDPGAGYYSTVATSGAGKLDGSVVPVTPYVADAAVYSPPPAATTATNPPPVATVPGIAGDSSTPVYDPSNPATYSGVPIGAVHPGFTSTTTGTLGTSTLGDYSTPGEQVFAHSAANGAWIPVTGPATTVIPGGATIGIGMGSPAPMARGGFARGLSLVGDRDSGTPTGHEEMVYAPQGAMVFNHNQTLQALGGMNGLRSALGGNRMFGSRPMMLNGGATNSVSRLAHGGMIQPLVAGADPSNSVNPGGPMQTTSSMGGFGSWTGFHWPGSGTGTPPTSTGTGGTMPGGPMQPPATTTSTLPLGLPQSAFDQALQLRTGNPYPQLDPYSVTFPFELPSMQKGFEQGFQDQYGVPAADVAAAAQNYQQQGLGRGYGLTLGELNQGIGY